MAPDLERLARMPCPMASLASSGIRLLSSALDVLVLQEGGSALPKQPGEFSPGIGRTHVDDANRLDAGPRRLGAQQPRGLAALDAAPELLLGCEQEVTARRSWRSCR
jgi:hypothetical protein